MSQRGVFFKKKNMVGQGGLLIIKLKKVHGIKQPEALHAKCTLKLYP